MTIGTHYLLDAFIREGISHLFMVPGGLVDPFLPALGRFPLVKPIITAMATALTDSSKVFIMSGEVAVAMEGLGQFQDASAETLDDSVLAAPVTRFSTSVDSVLNLNHLFRRALMEMAGPPAGPVHLS